MKEKFTEVHPLSGETFKLKLTDDNFGENSILYFSENKKVMVTKVYPFTKWKRFLFWLGFSIKTMDLKEIE